MLRTLSRCCKFARNVHEIKLLNLVKQTYSPPLFSRSFSLTSIVKQEEDMEELKKNPYYAKYAEKLKQLEQNKPEEFQSKLNVLEADKERLAEEEKQKAEEQRKKLEEQAIQAQAGKLKALMKVELLEDKTPEEIEQIWLEYHKDKDVIFGVIPVNEYEQLMERAKEFKTFLYPLPRDQGYEFIVQQFDGHMINFTPLIAFQAYGENAPPCLRITHYTEVIDKGIVLMRGEPDPKVLTVHEAQLLALQVKMYYGVNTGLKFNLVRQFNTTPDAFKHQDLIKEFENYKKDIQTKKEATF